MASSSFCSESEGPESSGELEQDHPSDPTSCILNSLKTPMPSDICRKRNMTPTIIYTSYEVFLVPHSGKFSRSSRIGLLKHFAEINFADRRFLMAAPIIRNISVRLIFVVREESAKLMHLKNLALYGII